MNAVLSRYNEDFRRFNTVIFYVQCMINFSTADVWSRPRFYFHQKKARQIDTRKFI